MQRRRLHCLGAKNEDEGTHLDLSARCRVNIDGGVVTVVR
jgi:hypothetical protein